MKYLSIDFGGKRTGMAVGSDITGQAGPIGVIESPDIEQVIRKIHAAIEEYAPGELVVGMPFNMDGTMGAGAQKIEQIAQRLERETGLVVHRVDERLTTFEADELMKQSGLTHGQKKSRRDALAAMAILKDFLASRGE